MKNSQQEKSLKQSVSFKQKQRRASLILKQKGLLEKIGLDKDGDWKMLWEITIIETTLKQGWLKKSKGGIKLHRKKQDGYF